MDIHLGVVSHRIFSISVKSLEKHGIHGYFLCVVSPQIANAPLGKNGSEMWQYALKKVQCKPSEVVHVDD